MTVNEFMESLMKEKQRLWMISPYTDIKSCIMNHYKWDKLKLDADIQYQTKKVAASALHPQKRQICGIDIILTTDADVFLWIPELSKT